MSVVEQVLARDVKRTDNKRAFQLDSSDRIEWLLPIKARVFNRSRVDGKKWREVPDVPANRVIERPAAPTGETRDNLRAEGYLKDYEWFAARNARTNKLEPAKPVTNPGVRKDSDMAKNKSDTAVAEKPKAKAKAKTPKTEGKVRPKFEGFGVVAWLCYMGSKGFSWQRAAGVLKKMGLETTETTARLYVAGGKKNPAWVPGGEKGGPAMTKAARTAFNAIAETVDEVEEPAPKPKTKAPAKKPAAKKPKAPKEETVEADDDSDREELAE